MAEQTSNRKNKLGLVLVFFTFVFLLYLGTWQLQRMAWKNAMLDAIETGLSKPAVALNFDQTLPAYSKVSFEGVFDHESELYLHTIHTSGKPGFNIYTPLTNAKGQTIIVNRGFVLPEMIDPETRLNGQPLGVVSVAGVLKEGAQKKYFIPDNNPVTNRWFYADLNAMASAVGLEQAYVYPLILEASHNPEAEAVPKGVKPRLNIPNNHLGYAVTWFGMALALLVIVFVFARQQKANRGDE